MAASLSYLKTPVPGLIMIENFVTEAEERALIASLDGGNWRLDNFNGPKLIQYYGVGIDYKIRTVTGYSRPSVPDFFQPLFQKLRDEVPILNDFFPNQVGCNAYLRKDGHHIKAHVDDRTLSGPFIANLSLENHTYMTFTPERARPKTLPCPEVIYEDGPPALPVYRVAGEDGGESKKFEVLLPRRSLQIMSGDSRYYWKHAVLTENLLGDRRISITMRQTSLGLK